MEYSSYSLLSFQIDQIIDLLHEVFFNFSVVFLLNGFENDLGKALEEPRKRTVFRLLLDKVEKGISIAQFGQYQGSGSFLSFSYCSASILRHQV